MLVKVKLNGATISHAALIEGRTWGRYADLLDALGLAYKWKQGYPNELDIIHSDRDILGDSMNDVQLTENFNLREFMCSHCGSVIIDPELVRRLQKMRDELGEPIRINSAYRCPDYNRQIGGASNSQHTTGRAADLAGTHLAELAEKYFFDGGIGLYTNHIHVDTGPRRRWEG